MNIQFPTDFTISENPFLFNSINYIHTREDGSIISILESSNKKNNYEIWDELYMNDVEIMSYDELFNYLSKETHRQLTLGICFN